MGRYRCCTISAFKLLVTPPISPQTCKINPIVSGLCLNPPRSPTLTYVLLYTEIKHIRCIAHDVFVQYSFHWLFVTNCIHEVTCLSHHSPVIGHFSNGMVLCVTLVKENREQATLVTCNNNTSQVILYIHISTTSQCKSDVIHINLVKAQIRSYDQMHQR